MTQIIEISTIR